MEKPRKRLGEILGEAFSAVENRAVGLVAEALESLLSKGAVLETENLEVEVKGLNGKPVLRLTFKGKLTVKALAKE